MNKIGSLYQVKKHYWFFFPNKETAAAFLTLALARALGPADVPHAAAAFAAYWSKHFNCNVTYVSPRDIFVLLEVDGKFKKVLSTDGTVGWTWFEDEFNECFEEVTRP